IVAAPVSAPLTVFPGTPATVQVSFASVHANPLGPFEYGLFLLPAAVTMPSGSPLSSAIIQLGAFGAVEESITVVVPQNTALGRYRFALGVDTGGVIAEPNESNNVGLSEFVRVDTPRPDLTVPAIRTATASEPGGPLAVSFTLANQGAVPASAAWQVVLSKNAVVTVDDQVIDAGTEMVAATSTAGVSRTVTLPSDLPNGRYTLGVVVDPEDAVVEASEINNVALAPEPVLIAQTGLSIADAALPPMYVGIPFTTFLTPVGGDGVYDWQVTSGALPRGLFLVAATGELQGTPSDLGSSTFTVDVSSGGESASATYTVEVIRPIGAFSIATRQLLPAVVGANYPPGDPMEPQRLRTLGGTGDVTFTLDSPPPPGIELSSEGVFSGVPVQSGRFSIDVRATDAAMAEATKTLFLTVGEPGRITLISDPLPDGTVGVPYQAQLRFIGAASTATPTFSSMGTLPSGLVVASTGILAGTPRAPGNFSFAVQVSEGPDGMGQVDTALFDLAIRADDSLSFRREGESEVTVGEEVSLRLIAVGGTPPFSWRGGADLPEGLSADLIGSEGNAYEITGTLMEEGLVTILAELSDADMRLVQEPVSIRFLAAPPPPPVEDPGGGCAAQS
ncbi:MAG: putative Ig domain-containing protein, partial [Myxococcota bacterium]